MSRRIGPATGHGFTLVEMTVVIVLTGIVAAMISVFIRSPVMIYQNTVRRAALTDAADAALRRILREVRVALPNSINTPNATSLVLIPTTGGGRYRQYPGAAGGNVLNPDAGDNAFDVLGPVPLYGAGDELVIYNEPDSGRNAYLGNNRQALAAPYPAAGRVSTDANPFTVTLTAAQSFFPGSPSARFHIVQTPVIYVCAPNVLNPAAGVLTRHAVTFAQAQAYIANPAAALPAGQILTAGVTACTFTYSNDALRQRSGLVTLWLSLGSNDVSGNLEVVRLTMQAHVNNQP